MKKVITNLGLLSVFLLSGCYQTNVKVPKVEKKIYQHKLKEKQIRDVHNIKGSKKKLYTSKKKKSIKMSQSKFKEKLIKQQNINVTIH